MAKQTAQPILILPEGYTRTMGKDAQRTNIMAAKMVAETVRTTLGPKGMDKMLVDSLGDIVITNDGVTILQEMEIEHPAAKMMVEIAKTQDEEVGDGTTTAVVIGGELLKKAEELLEQNIHPTIIAKGYKLATEKANEILNGIAETISTKDRDILKKIVVTAISGKSCGGNIGSILPEMIVKAVERVVEEKEGKLYLDMDNIKIEKKTGSGIEDSELIEGVTIDKERIHPGMPSLVKDAKILLMSCAIEVEKTETDAKIQITHPDQLRSFVEQEENILKTMVDKIKKTKANVVFCQKGMDDIAEFFLSKAGTYALKNIKESDIQKIAKATGAKVLTTLDEASENDLGYAGLVEEIKIAGEAMTFVRKCKNPKAVTLLLRGGTEHVIDEVERAVKDGLGDLGAVMETKKVVAGGGAPEMAVSLELLNWSQTLSGREQLAVKAFAEALEVIPRTLAENAGLDPIDMIVGLKSAHEKKKKWSGVNVFEGKVTDMWSLGVIEPLKVKTQAIKSASEAAIMLLRIDDILAAGRIGGDKGMAGMPPGGMGGMSPEY